MAIQYLLSSRLTVLKGVGKVVGFVGKEHSAGESSYSVANRGWNIGVHPVYVQDFAVLVEPRPLDLERPLAVAARLPF